MTEVDVVVIGAGLAGLGAAAALRERGRAAVVLEAADRIGGRAWTVHPAALGGAWFDMGAVWLHDAEHNPLVADRPRPPATTLLRSDGSARNAPSSARARRRRPNTPITTPPGIATRRPPTHCWRPRADAPLAAVAHRLADDPWALTVEAFEGPVICVAEAEQFSLRDWRRNVLDGSNLVPRGRHRRLRRPPAGRRAGHQAEHPGDARCAGTGRRPGRGGDAASAPCSAAPAIVTVSTGVLAAGAIAFDPALPADGAGRHRRAADGPGDEGGAARHRDRTGWTCRCIARSIARWRGAGSR